MIRSTKNRHRAAWTALATAGALCLALTPASAAAQDVIDVRAGAAAIDFEPTVAHGGLVLTVSGPDGFYHREEFGAGESATFSIFDRDGGALPDGSYTWELTAAPTDVQRREALEANRLESRRQTQGITPVVQSGSFAVIGGSLVAAGAREPGAEGDATASSDAPNRITTKDQVINDDLIVTGSECVGFDCVNGESFGFDTIRLKENNLRIKFEDTSTAGGFPSNDWQLTANDSASGGANKFSIDDVTNAKTPFTVEGNASSNSIYVDSTGRVGFRTSTPVLDLHVATGNTPALRLEQNTSSGFSAQTFDIAANEANFFVRDVTGGSTLPLRIRPGAPTSSLDIAANGNVGVGTASPDASLHVAGSDGLTSVRVEEESATESARELAQFFNNGTVTYRFTDTQGTASGADDFNWIAGLKTNNRFIITLVGSIGSPLWEMDSSGNVTATSFNPTSSRELKEEFVPVEPESILQRVASLPIREWSYKDDVSDSRHLGPVAEDFRAAFGLGQDDRHISLIDLGGVSLAAIQALNELVEDKDREIDQLRGELDELRAMVEGLAGSGSSPAVPTP